MRYQLLALTASAALLAVSGTASAQVPVTDARSEASLVQQVMTAGKELASLQQQYNELVATYRQVASQYQMLTRFADPNGIAQELEQPFLRNPLPNVQSLPGMLTSGAGLSGTPYAQQFLNANRVYTAPTTYQGGRLMNTQASALASIQGTATTNLQSIQERVVGLDDLQNQLNRATTIQQVASINARINAEQNYVAAQQAQAANLQTITEAQIAAQQQAQQQMVRQQATQAAAQFPVSVP